MNQASKEHPGGIDTRRLAAVAALVLLAAGASYRAWLDIATIAWQDPEQSQVLLALPIVVLLLWFRRDALSRAPVATSPLGAVLVAVGCGLSVYGYLNNVQTYWHFGAVAMVVGAAWSVLGDRFMLAALPAVIAVVALVPVPNLIRQDIALPLQRLTATGAEFVLIAFGFSVKRMGQTLLYQGKPVTIEEACNGMRMVFALVLVCYGFAMAFRLNPFARVLLIGVSPLLAVMSNIVRVVPTVVIYGEYDQAAGDLFHDLSGWAMIVVAVLLLFGLIRLLAWAEVPIYAEANPIPKARPAPRRAPAGSPGLIGPVVSAVIAMTAIGYSLSLPSAIDARPYHLAVAKTADATPKQIDGLDALPQVIPEGSVRLLRPNTARAVQYDDPQTGIGGQFLMIQCKDARDLSGHYPPRCYPNVRGWVEIKQERETRQWEVDGLTIQGVRYVFAETEQRGAPRYIVMHFFVLPHDGAGGTAKGVTTGDLTEMRRAAADYLRRHRGAAQVQMLFNEAGTTPRQRDRLFTRVLQAHLGLLRAILDNPSPQAHVTD